MSNLINGFSDYKSLSSFFQNMSKDMKKNGECNLSGSELLERFCKRDGVSNRRTIKAMFVNKEQSILFSDVNSYDDLKLLWSKHDFDQTLINNYFENRSNQDFSILDEPNYDEAHECFYIHSPIGDILFGETEKAPYFSKHINKKAKYFVTVDSNGLVDEDPELTKTFSSDSFFMTLKRAKMIVNRYRNEDFMDTISESHFFHEIRADKSIAEEINKIRVEKSNIKNCTYFNDKEIMSLLHNKSNFKRKLSNSLFLEIKEYFNQKDFYSLVGYKKSDNVFDDVLNVDVKPTLIVDFLSFEIDAIDFPKNKLFDTYQTLCIIYKNEVTQFIMQQDDI